MSQSAGQSTLLTASSSQPSSASPVVNSTNEAVEVSSEKSTEVSKQSDTVCSKYSALLDGKFFRVVSATDGGTGTIKAACVSCPAGKKPLSGSLGATTNFLLHLKVGAAAV
jgi:hypothetical protein